MHIFRNRQQLAVETMRWVYSRSRKANKGEGMARYRGQ